MGLTWDSHGTHIGLTTEGRHRLLHVFYSLFLRSFIRKVSGVNLHTFVTTVSCLCHNCFTLRKFFECHKVIIYTDKAIWRFEKQPYSFFRYYLIHTIVLSCIVFSFIGFSVPSFWFTRKAFPSGRAMSLPLRLYIMVPLPPERT